MAIMREKLKEHIERYEMKRYEQAGFTGGASILKNLFVLQKGVQQAYRSGEEIVMVAVDFRKAFDSVRRERLWSC